MAGASHVAIRAVAAAYVLVAVCGCSGGSSSSKPVAQPPVIGSFAARPSWITSGQSATLEWTITDATSVSIDTLGPQSGASVSVTPTADTTYTLTASNQYGSVQAQVTLAVFPPPATWFAPIGATSAIPVKGAADYFDLFSPTAAWANAAAHVAVFKMYSQMLDLDDATLRTMFADLRRRHIAFAIEWGPLDGGGMCGDGIEGFTGAAALHYAQRIRDLGATLQYVAFDEPFEFGSVYSGRNSCRWTPQQVAHNAAQNVAQIRSLFPDVVVGDIEVVPDGDANDSWLGAYEQWLDAWQAETGRPLAFFHFDVDWGNNWKPAAAALTRALAKRSIPVGHIYNGGGSSDAAWLALAEQHMTDFETRVGLVADQAIFQSWEPYPKHLLPETDPTAFTYLIDRYFRERTTLTLSSGTTGGQGTLATASGPLASATMALSAVPLSGTGQTNAYTVSGSVPAGAQYVVFGARVALENCGAVALPSEFYLTDFTLDAGTAGQLHADFTNQLTGWGIWGNPTIAQVEGTSLHVQVTPGETMGLNSASLPFAAAAGGAAYTLTVNAMIPLGSRGDGCAIAVFQDASFNELGRAALEIVPLPFAVGSPQTDAAGVFTFSLASQAAPFVLWADYAGSDTLWPAAAAVLVNAPPPTVIATSALPDATVGTPYAQPLGASGGRQPYLWVGGPMPPGLLLGQDGALVGVPTRAGTYSISVSVVDDSAPTQVADAALQLVVH